METMKPLATIFECLLGVRHFQLPFFLGKGWVKENIKVMVINNSKFLAGRNHHSLDIEDTEMQRWELTCVHLHSW